MFWDTLSIVVDKVILPVTSRIRNDDWLVQFVLITLPVVVYVVHWEKLKKENTLFSNRLVNLAFVFAAFVFIYFSGKFELYGLEYLGKVSYLHTIFVTVALFEWHIFCEKKEKTKQQKLFGQPKQKIKPNKGFYSDLPTDKNGFDREKYAEHLIDEIIRSYENDIVQESSFSILLSERYGMGKSSFIKLLKLKAKDKPLCIVDFKPWLSRGSDQIILNFFELLRSELGSNNRKLSRLLKSYAVLATESAYSKTLSAIVGELLLSENSIESQYESIKEELRKKKQPILVIVDDVDRLQSEELMTLIKLLRNTADFPNIFYLVAADKIAISESIRPYNIGDVDLYLKKFFNLELLFPADDNCLKENLKKSITEVLQQFSVDQAEIDHVIEGVLNIKDWNEIFLNVRDVIRFKNQVVFNLGIINESKLLKDVDLLDFYLLSIIQYMDETIYKILRDKHSLFLESSKQDGRLSPKKDFEEVFVTHFKKELHQKHQSFKSIKVKHNNVVEIQPQIADVLDNAHPKKEQIVCELIGELFGGRGNYRVKSRICYSYEYFKYFSGKYRRNEMSDQDAFRLLRSKDDDFANNILTVIQENKDDAFIHKLIKYIEEQEYKRLDVLKKIIILFDALVTEVSNEFEIFDETSFFVNKHIYAAVYELYIVGYTKLNSQSDLGLNLESTDHQTFFERDTRYRKLAIILNALRKDAHNELIFQDNMIQCWRDQLIDRFFENKLLKEPFEKDTIEAIHTMRMLNSHKWDERFSAYAKATADPMEWIYRLVKYEKGTLMWNFDFIDSMEKDMFALDGYAVRILWDSLDVIIKEDLGNLRTSNPITVEQMGSHKFLQEALVWWKKKNQADIII